MRIQDLHVEHRIDTDLDIVTCDADLFGDIERLFFQAVLVCDTLDERNQNVEASLQRTAVLAEIFDHVRALLRNHGRSTRDQNHNDDGDNDENVGCVHEGFRKQMIRCRAEPEA